MDPEYSEEYEEPRLKRAREDLDDWVVGAQFPEEVDMPEYFVPRGKPRKRSPQERADDIAAYSSKCLQEAKACFWEFFAQQCLERQKDGRYKIYDKDTRTWRFAVLPEGWRRKRLVTLKADIVFACGTLRDEYYDRVHAKCFHFCYLRGADYVDFSGKRYPADPRDLKGHLFIFRDNLFLGADVHLSCNCEPSSLTSYRCTEHTDATAMLRLVKVHSMSEIPDPADARDPSHNDLLYDYGLASNYLKAISQLGAPPPDFLNNIRDPIHGCQQRVVYSTDSSLPTLSSAREVELMPKQRAVIMGLSHALELIHGPPGTGKSTCIRAIIRERLPHGANDAVLVTAVQNKAVDVLVAMFEPHVTTDFSESVCPMVVVGAPNNLGPTAAKYALETLIDANSKVKDAAIKHDICPTSSPAYKCLKKKLLAELKRLRREVSERIQANAAIALGTTTEVHKLLSSPRVKTLQERITSVVVDEAGTVPEYHMAIVARLPHVERIVCLGDVCQLPPFSVARTNKSTDAPQGFLDRVQTIVERCGMAVPMLVEQFRMHPDISRFVSDSFYGGRLVDTQLAGAVVRHTAFTPGTLHLTGLYVLRYPKAHIRADNLYYKSAALSSLQFDHADNKGSEDVEAKSGTSTINCTEALHVIEVLESLQYARLLEGSKTVAVITFYKAQADFLTALLTIEEHYPNSNPDIRAAIFQAVQSGVISVQTVDSSQGGEVDIVILGCVRANKRDEIGFLGTREGKNRICVASSRAREALIVIAGPTIEYVKSLGSVVTPDDGASKKITRLVYASDLLKPLYASQKMQSAARETADLFGLDSWPFLAQSATPAAGAPTADARATSGQALRLAVEAKEEMG